MVPLLQTRTSVIDKTPCHGSAICPSHVEHEMQIELLVQIK